MVYFSRETFLVISHLKNNLRTIFFSPVQNGSMHQKDGVNDEDFEPYLSSQTNQVSECTHCVQACQPCNLTVHSIDVLFAPFEPA